MRVDPVDTDGARLGGGWQEVQCTRSRWPPFAKWPEGWGVLDAPGFPGGAWVHLPLIAGDGQRMLDLGEWVRADISLGQQTGYDFRAERVQRLTGPA